MELHINKYGILKFPECIMDIYRNGNKILCYVNGISVVYYLHIVRKLMKALFVSEKSALNDRRCSRPVRAGL